MPLAMPPQPLSRPPQSPSIYPSLPTNGKFKPTILVVDPSTVILSPNEGLVLKSGLLSNGHNKGHNGAAILSPPQRMLDDDDIVILDASPPPPPPVSRRSWRKGASCRKSPPIASNGVGNSETIVDLTVEDERTESKVIAKIGRLRGGARIADPRREIYSLDDETEIVCLEDDATPKPPDPATIQESPRPPPIVIESSAEPPKQRTLCESLLDHLTKESETLALEASEMDAMYAALKSESSALTKALSQLLAYHASRDVHRQGLSFVAKYMPVTLFSNKRPAAMLKNHLLVEERSSSQERRHREAESQHLVDGASVAAVADSVSQSEDGDLSKAGGLAALAQTNCEELLSVRGTTRHIRAILRLIENEVDSDASESCSSDEEDDKPTKVETTPVPTEGGTGLGASAQRYRAACEYAKLQLLRKRSRFGSQWVWSMNQVSDLEYKIRYTKEKYNHMRHTKFNVGFADSVSATSSPSKSHCSPFKQVNGYVVTPRPEQSCPKPESCTSSSSSDAPTSPTPPSEPDPAPTDPVTPSDPAQTPTPSPVKSDPTLLDHTYVSCRTRPLRIPFRRRRLLSFPSVPLPSSSVPPPTAGQYPPPYLRSPHLPLINCGCSYPGQTCVACLGKPIRTPSYPDVDFLSERERIALTCPTYHPQLSFLKDVSVTTLSTRPMVDHTFLRSVQKNREIGSLKRKYRAFAAERGHLRKLLKSSDARMVNRDVYPDESSNGAATGSGSTHIARKRARVSESSRNRSTSLSSGASSRPASPAHDSMEGQPVARRSRAASPILQGVPAHLYDAYLRKRRTESSSSAFDIDNIVIPYSMAASARVEKLQYKEIVTPKWRVIDLAPLNPTDADTTAPGEETEDVTDEMVEARHEISLANERQRFLYASGGGMRRARASRAGSGSQERPINDPYFSLDPLSPATMDSPLATPPATPLTAPPHDESSNSSQRSRSASVNTREMQPVSPEMVEVTPFEARVFPLHDSTYDEMLSQSSHEPFDFITPVDPVIPTRPAKRARNTSGLSTSSSIVNEFVCPSSPASTTTSSSISNESLSDLVESDDPNDPEWTVAMTSKKKNGIILKLSKR